MVPRPALALLLREHPVFGTSSPVDHEYGHRYHSVRATLGLGASLLLLLTLSHTDRDVRSWTDLLTLPALVLAAPSRGGRRHTLRLGNDARRRCLDWVNGIKADLWAPDHGGRVRPRKGHVPDYEGDALPDSVVARVSTLLQE